MFIVLFFRHTWLKTCHVDVVDFLSLSVCGAVSWFLTMLFGGLFKCSVTLFSFLQIVIYIVNVKFSKIPTFVRQCTN